MRLELLLFLKFGKNALKVRDGFRIVEFAVHRVMVRVCVTNILREWISSLDEVCPC
jgi:hypothetical protein